MEIPVEYILQRGEHPRIRGSQADKITLDDQASVGKSINHHVIRDRQVNI
jgi:hypothetical protein